MVGGGGHEIVLFCFLKPFTPAPDVVGEVAGEGRGSQGWLV